MKTWPALALVAALAVPANAQESRPTPSIVELESKLDQAVRDMKTLSGTIESLRSELDSLKQSPPPASDSVAGRTHHELSQAAPEPSKEAADELADRIVGPDLGQNERDHTLGAKPEIFIQTRYSVAPIKGSEAAFDPNFRISRAEARWAGKITDRIGAGLRQNLSARRETGDAELLKVGETSLSNLPAQPAWQPRAKPEAMLREGVETRRAAPNLRQSGAR